jgi:glycosyltransferase involved in cell wall biosynthesis
MRIGVDLRHVPLDGPGAGVAHASKRLAKELRVEELNGPGSFLRVREFVRTKHIDALMVPSGAVPPFVPCKTYPWVHDLAIFEHPEWFPQPFWKRKLTTGLFLHGLKRSSHVFCVSGTTKAQIVRHAKIDREKITVARIGIDPIGDVKPYQNGKSYGIAIGTIEPRKNYSFLIERWRDVRARTDAELFILGKKGWGKVELPNEPWLHVIEHASDDERDAYIAGASILVQASLYEGFGMPLLEAMRASVPVVCSDRGSLPEIAGDAAIVLPLEDQRAWSSAIETIIHSTERRHDLIARGLRRVREFSWAKTASLMLAKLQELG